jgi:HD-like signal output (HDOD) protein
MPGSVVLFVDGERFVRESVQTLLAGDVEVIAVATPQEGQRALRERVVDVVLTDYRVGTADGVQFLRQVREEHPDVTRILTSGFLDQTIHTRFLSSGLANAFIAKPWEDARLRGMVGHILGVRAILRRRELLDAVGGVGTLPTLPVLFHDLVLAVEDGKPMKDIAALLEHDPAVATRLLHVANSAFFGNREVSRIEEAVVYLGASLLKDLVLTTELLKGERWSEEQRAEVARIFHHSFAVNRVLPTVHQVLYQKTLDSRDTSAGIVHDIGKLVLLRSFPNRYGAAVAASVPGRLDAFHHAEIEAGHAGATHAEIGGWLLAFWNLPSHLAEVALFHHDPARAHPDNARLLQAVALANRLVHLAESPPEARAEATPDLGVPGIGADRISRLQVTVRTELDSLRGRPMP